MRTPAPEAAAARPPLPREGLNIVILQQLRRIRDSHSFCNSARSKEFLSYVVEHGLEGHEELLKERSIGVNLFQRNPDYITSEDPIVRVKAAEVRRRLAQFYAEEEETPEVRIEIPVGSYIPRFHWRNRRTGNRLRRRSSAAAAIEAREGIATLENPGFGGSSCGRRNRGGSLHWISLRPPYNTRSILGTSFRHKATGPDLRTLSGRLCDELRSLPEIAPCHFRSLQFGGEANVTPLQLDPETSVKWKEITPLVDFFVNKDDAYAAEELSTFFAGHHRPTQMRLGNDYTYEDLRSSPAILVGAYNNPWIDRVMSDLPIGFRESGTVLWIEDRTQPDRVWRASTNGRLGNKDFALVARILNSKTGQFLVILSGVGMVGTKAAGGLISREQDLETALHGAPNGWERKNMEVVLETDIVEGNASPSRVVAVKVW